MPLGHLKVWMALPSTQRSHNMCGKQFSIHHHQQSIPDGRHVLSCFLYKFWLVPGSLTSQRWVGEGNGPSEGLCWGLNSLHIVKGYCPSFWQTALGSPMETYWVGWICSWYFHLGIPKVQSVLVVIENRWVHKMVLNFLLCWSVSHMADEVVVCLLSHLRIRRWILDILVGKWWYHSRVLLTSCLSGWWSNWRMVSLIILIQKM